MNDYVLQFLIPVMSVLACIFVIAIYLESRQNRINSADAKASMEKNTVQLASIDDTLTDMHRDFKNIVIPALDGISSNTLIPRKLTFSDVEKCLADIGITKFKYLNQQKTTIIFGLKNGQLIINYIIYLTEPFSELNIMAFGLGLKNPTESLLQFILNMNATFKLGAIGLKDTGDQKVITITKSILGDITNLSAANLNYVVQGLLHGTLILQKQIKEGQETVETVNVNQLLKTLQAQAAA